MPYLSRTRPIFKNPNNEIFPVTKIFQHICSFPQETKTALHKGSRICHKIRCFPFIQIEYTNLRDCMLLDSSDCTAVITKHCKAKKRKREKKEMYWRKPPKSYRLHNATPKHHQGQQSSSPHVILTPAMWKMLPKH